MKFSFFTAEKNLFILLRLIVVICLLLTGDKGDRGMMGLPGMKGEPGVSAPGLPGRYFDIK